MKKPNMNKNISLKEYMTSFNDINNKTKKEKKKMMLMLPITHTHTFSHSALRCIA